MPAKITKDGMIKKLNRENEKLKRESLEKYKFDMKFLIGLFSLISLESYIAEFYYLSFISFLCFVVYLALLIKASREHENKS